MTMQQQLFETKTAPLQHLGIVPRPYQHEAHDECIKLWDAGTTGVLIRAATGTGKTIIASMIADTWLARSERHRCMVISYEKQLVWQFAQELEDVLGIKPGIEMEKEELEDIPQLIVASRQTLMRHRLATDEQKQQLAEYGIHEIGLTTYARAKRYLRLLSKGGEPEIVSDMIAEFQQDYRCDHETGQVSRLHKFDPHRYAWMLVWDEAHKHAHHLNTVGHVYDWFSVNPEFRQCGMTATPKRSDNVSIGDVMFPGIAIDYPLWSPKGRCSVKDGWSVPYVQKYIQVESVDFDEIKRLAGNSQEKWDSEIAKRLETELATYCEPMLDMVEDRRTLIFSPSVQMAKNVRDYINARRCVLCHCGERQWIARCLIGDGGKCRQCGRELTESDIVKDRTEAQSVDGTMPPSTRREIYKWHQTGQGQFLSVCGLCREGYNDRAIGAVAIFRPVRKAASSLAEQMKGRSSRVLEGLVEGLATPEDRLEAVANSAKPYALVIDLVGVTGLGDCATTVQIYAEGLPDEVVKRAEEIAQDGEEDIQAAVEQAELEIEEEKERQRLEREERERVARKIAEQRAAARAKAKYTVHDVGYSTKNNTHLASEAQLKYLRFLGLEISGWEPTKKQAGRMIDQLTEQDMSIEDVVYSNNVPDGCWQRATATKKQIGYLRWKGVRVADNCTPKQASEMIDRIKNGKPAPPPPANNVQRYLDRINNADGQTLSAIAMEVQSEFSSFGLSRQDYDRIVAAGKKQREALKVLEYLK